MTWINNSSAYLKGRTFKY